jgi:peroxiredoxin
LNAGDRAPEFQLQTDEGRSVSLSALSDNPLVLFFYPNQAKFFDGRGVWV